MRAFLLAFLCGIVAFPAWGQRDLRPGDQIEIKVSDLPSPYATDSAANGANRISRGDARPIVPDGFKVSLFAEDIRHPRRLLALKSGAVLVVQSRPGHISVLEDTDKDGTADRRRVLQEGFSTPFGIALDGNKLLVSDLNAIWEAGFDPETAQLTAPFRPLTAKGALGPDSGHWTRNLAISPDGQSLYVAIGSRGNIGEEPEPRATIQRFNRAGGEQKTFAAGLRNPVGMAFHPETGELWTVVNERDGLGDELAPDYLAKVVEDGFYGWPYAYAGKLPQPRYASRRPDLVAKSRLPEVLIRSHSAPIGLTFYTGNQFPKEYQGNAFVALRGSWNAAVPRGYFVTRMPFEKGQALGHYEVFATGFWTEGDVNAGVWGRPAAVEVTADGALLIGDDTGDTIWRVDWIGSK